MVEHLNRYWVGIDVSKSKFDAAACIAGSIPQDWRAADAKRFKSDEAGVASFVKWLRSREGICAGLCAESTGIYSADLAGLIAAQDAALPGLSIVNPAHIKGTARALGARDKSDAVDARLIAAYAAWRQPACRPPRTGAWAQLRALAQARECLIEARGAFGCRAHNSRDTACVEVFTRAAASLGNEVMAIDALIDETIESDATVRRHAELLQSVPCIGRVIAITLLGAFGDLTKWTREQLVSAAGLYPRSHESGSSVRGKAHLAKGGFAIVRSKLYMGAIHLLANDYGFNATALRMKDTKRPKMVCIGAAMRKLLIVARAVVVADKDYERRNVTNVTR